MCREIGKIQVLQSSYLTCSAISMTPCVRKPHVVTGHYVETTLSMHVDWRTTVRMLIQRQVAAPRQSNFGLKK
jgi:hypothetical protein